MKHFTFMISLTICNWGGFIPTNMASHYTKSFGDYSISFPGKFYIQFPIVLWNEHLKTIHLYSYSSAMLPFSKFWHFITKRILNNTTLKLSCTTYKILEKNQAILIWFVICHTLTVIRLLSSVYTLY